jgi:putative tryptophan/tyrosine transport system substrate-binding protein
MRRREFVLLVGMTAGWPFGALGQQAAKAVGFLSARSAADSQAVLASFLKSIGETGLVEGRDFKVEYLWANGSSDALPDLARELVAKRVAVIAAVGGPLVARAAVDATKNIPIVFVIGTDPVQSALVTSLNRPSGNATGVTLYAADLEQKKLQLLSEVVPGAVRVGVLLNPLRLGVVDVRADIEVAARSLRVSVDFLLAETVSEIDVAFETIGTKKLQALVVGADGFFTTHRKQIIRLAAEHVIPAIYDSAIQVEEGGLMSYGSSYVEAYRQAGLYVGRILKGVQPADLPVLLPTKFEMSINLKTAKALGIAFPPELLTGADQVIE